MMPFVWAVATLLAGVGIGDVLDNVFSKRQTPVQAVVGVNWLRVVITVAVIFAVLWLVRNVFKVKMEV